MHASMHLLNPEEIVAALNISALNLWPQFALLFSRSQASTYRSNIFQQSKNRLEQPMQPHSQHFVRRQQSQFLGFLSVQNKQTLRCFSILFFYARPPDNF